MWQKLLQLCALATVSFTLFGCQDAQYDSFDWGPNGGKAEEQTQVENIE